MSPRCLALAIALVLAAAAGPSTAPAWANEVLLERLLWRVNYHRERHGLEPLRKHPKLMAAAQSHSEAMLTGACFAHTCPEGPDLSERLSRVGYRFRIASENIAAGFERPERVVDSWMDSASHRRNMLDPEVVEAGLGYAFVERRRDAQALGHYWTLDLGARLGQGTRSEWGGVIPRRRPK